MVDPMNPGYTRHHPRWYRTRIPIFWWLRGRAYVLFITRELTALAVGYAALLLLLEVWLLGQGPEAHAALRAWLHHPAVIALHVIVFLAALYHAITWIGLAPRALVVRLGSHRVSPRLILVGHYAALIAASAALIWLLAGG